MSSTTSSRRNIADFLWEWAGSDDWRKLMLDKIVSTEDYLSDPEREEVYNYFLQSIKLKSGLPPLSIIKPGFSSSNKKVDLISLSEINGVNKLSNKQVLDFERNITVIYGQNGSGKTGYCRILKSLGYSYDKDKTILRNVNIKGNTNQSASIKYKVDEAEKDFAWDGSNSNTDLQNISVFNNNCVQLSLSDRNLLITPAGFHLFNIVSEELELLAELLQTTIDKYPTTFNWTSNLSDNTPQQLYINNLTGSSNIPTLDSLSSFNDKDQIILNEKEQELINLNKNLIEAELNSRILQGKELEVIIGKIKNASTLINKESWDKIKRSYDEIKLLELSTQTSLKEVAEKNKVSFYESEIFKSFINAADNYIKLLKQESSDEITTCIYCKQDLNSENAKELLDTYYQVLNNHSQEKIKSQKESIDRIKKSIASIDSNVSFHQPTFGKDENDMCNTPEIILQYNTKINELKTNIEKNSLDELEELDYSSCIDFLEKKGAEISQQIEKNKETLKNIVENEREIRSIIHELKDRKTFFTKIDEIKTVIANKKIVHILLKNKNSFNTSAISRKTTEARDELVSQNFHSIFLDELKFLRKSDIEIELNFATSRGQSKISQKIKSNYTLSQILSEGEQKAISLAEFFTELQLDTSKAPIIFDDPVNSLDHHIIDDVAKRLMTISSERQIIIFTHSVLLFNSLIYHGKLPTNKQLLHKHYNIKSEYEETGILSENADERESVNYYKTKLNKMIEDKSTDKPESDKAASGFGLLRSAVEVLVEQTVLNETVKRYKKNVSLAGFIKIDGGLINKHKDKLNEIYDRCCQYTDAHSNPLEVVTEPTMKELVTDFSTVLEIHKEFNKS